MNRLIYRQLLTNQLVIMDALALMGINPAAVGSMIPNIHSTHEPLASSDLCEHEWEDGYSMNGPTKTCRKCGKFERD